MLDLDQTSDFTIWDLGKILRNEEEIMAVTNSWEENHLLVMSSKLYSCLKSLNNINVVEHLKSN